MVRDSIQQAFGRIDTMEQFNRVMNVMVGDTEAVNRALDDTIDYVTGTGYTLDTAAAAVQNFVTRGVEVDKARSEEHTSELQSRFDLVCRLLLEKKNSV